MSYSMCTATKISHASEHQSTISNTLSVARSPSSGDSNKLHQAVNLRQPKEYAQFTGALFFDERGALISMTCILYWYFIDQQSAERTTSHIAHP